MGTEVLRPEGWTLKSFEVTGTGKEPLTDRNCGLFSLLEMGIDGNSTKL